MPLMNKYQITRKKRYEFIMPALTDKKIKSVKTEKKKIKEN